MHRHPASSTALLPLLMLILLLTACGAPSRYVLKTQHTEQDLYQDDLFGKPEKILSLDEVFYLTAEQKERFLKAYHSVEYRDLSDSHRIYKYLKNQLQYFNFYSETLTATEAMEQNAGNCLSLAILTRALTKLTSAGISFELARTPSIFQREGDLELSSQHIRTVVFNKNTRNTKQFIRPNMKVRIDYFSTAGSRTLRTVNKKEFYSMFYSNRAAEALIRGENNLAYWHIKEALEIQDDNLVAINMLGVLYQRIDQQVLAERAYRYGLSLGFDQLELLTNYHNYLTQNNRVEDAAVIARELENYDDPNPFKWLDLANKELSKNNYRQAIRLYEKAAEKAPYLHQPYAGLAKANFYLGRTNEAITAIQQALENAHTRQTTSLYQAKYEYFKNHQNTN
ncbi:tetratricopeptide repeat protein [Marinicella sediminis]|uniref:Tetratricopeptide repeat protein n=2 Tax=Marinicella sediminis TaxID=1792834 RepID=A0ABV7J6G8_9GAMM